MTREEFFETEIRRTGDIAEIIVEYYEGDKDKPIRLIGFHTDSSMLDIDILIEGYSYYLELLGTLEEIKSKRDVFGE